MKRTWTQAQEEYGQLGIIESICLRNFMCHDNLTFKFDPHMNFIIGRNGSGKSAVLTGIILALGGKSGSTGRYSSVKGFIKTGKNSATVSVTLKNCGPEAYKADEYGSKITVERYFNSDGISSYKLKSEGGKIISTSKEELINILNVMDIQIENPITVLTQEISRNFLVSKNSKADKLFQLFYRGTGLAKVHDDYNKALKQKEEAKLELKNKKSFLPEMEKDIKKLKSLLDKSSKITELKRELLWAQVIEFEKNRDESQEALNKVKTDYSEKNRMLVKYETEIAELAQNGSATLAEKKVSYDKMDKIRTDLGELNNKKISLQSEIRELQGTFSSHQREVKKFATESTSLENIINDIRMKNQNNLNEDKLRHESIMKDLNHKIMDAKNQINLLETKKNSVRESGASKQEKIDTCHAELQEIINDQNNVAREKQQLIEGLTNRINVFGPEMKNVLSDIRRAAAQGVFKVEPKGPIGFYINVKQPQWNFALQECLKPRFLKTFLCDNHSDTDQLVKIFNKHYQRNPPSIITTKFVSKVYDVAQYKTVCEHPTVLDMLDIEDPVIVNCLIDQISIENILLIADTNQARSLMLYKPPQKCRFAYTPNGDQYCHSPFRNYSCRTKNTICMLKTVNEDDIKKKDEELRVKEQAKIEKQKDKDSMMQQLRCVEQEIKEIDNRITHFKITLNQLRMRLRDEENSYEEPKDISCLESDLEQLVKDKAYHEEQLTASKDALDSKTLERDTLEKNIEQLKRELQKEKRQFETLSERIESCDSKKEKLESYIKRLKEQVKQMEPVLKDLEKTLADNVATVEISTKNAENISPRIDTRRPKETIQQIIYETEKFINKQKNCDRQALLNEYEDKIQNLNKAKFELDRQEKINARLDRMLAERFQEFQKICKNTSVSLTCCFTTLLKENNFSGYPDVNFDQKSLEIIAKPKKSSSKHAGKNNLAQLSGGERSYVTIAFLLSLWDRIHAPFRILDEYDVFMDSNNRHLSIHLLINTAKANKKVQYIFLSPLELPQIEDSDDVMVHRMPDPRK